MTTPRDEPMPIPALAPVVRLEDWGFEVGVILAGSIVGVDEEAGVTLVDDRLALLDDRSAVIDDRPVLVDDGRLALMDVATAPPMVVIFVPALRVNASLQQEYPENVPAGSQQNELLPQSVIDAPLLTGTVLVISATVVS